MLSLSPFSNTIQNVDACHFLFLCVSNVIAFLLLPSQCSKTCGSGVHVREVKCYQGEELGHSCDSALKPEAGQTCEVQACPTEAPGRKNAVCLLNCLSVKMATVILSPPSSPPVEEVCQDKATANCALVLKVKLCTHWYYRKACCQSCKSKAP